MKLSIDFSLKNIAMNLFVFVMAANLIYVSVAVFALLKMKQTVKTFENAGWSVVAISPMNHYRNYAPFFARVTVTSQGLNSVDAMFVSGVLRNNPSLNLVSQFVVDCKTGSVSYTAQSSVVSMPILGERVPADFFFSSLQYVFPNSLEMLKEFSCHS